jgi:hypothetical protein
VTVNVGLNSKWARCQPNSHSEQVNIKTDTQEWKSPQATLITDSPSKRRMCQLLYRCREAAPWHPQRKLAVGGRVTSDRERCALGSLPCMEASLEV